MAPTFIRTRKPRRIATTAAWIYGQRERKFAIVPSRAGTLALAADEHRLVGHRTRSRGDQRGAGDEHSGRCRRRRCRQRPSRHGRCASTRPKLRPRKQRRPASAPITATSRALELQLMAQLACRGMRAVATDTGSRRDRLAGRCAGGARARPCAPQAAVATHPAGSKEFRAACTRGDLPAAARALLQPGRGAIGRRCAISANWHAPSPTRSSRRLLA